MSENVALAKTIDLSGKNWYTEWMRNARFNGLLDPFIRSIHDLEIDERTQVIVCGSGPSLNNDLQKLVYDPAIIVANHSNLSTLLYYHIMPDYVVITDAGKATFERMNDMIEHQFCDSKFILPTHANHELVKLLRFNNHEPYFFVNASGSLTQTELQDRYNDLIQVMTPSLTYTDSDGKQVTPCLFQCGCVANAALMFAYYLKFLGQPIREVYLTGVDFSYPNNHNRCMTVHWNDEYDDYDVIVNPDRSLHDPELIKLNGLLTDPVQFNYYSDLRFIVNEIKRLKAFDVFTTSNNFIADFIEVKSF